VRKEQGDWRTGGKGKQGIERKEEGKNEAERLKVLEEKIEEKVSGKKVRKMGERIEKDRKDREEETRGRLRQRIKKLEERLVEEV
jgi:hypothetical protein